MSRKRLLMVLTVVALLGVIYLFWQRANESSISIPSSPPYSLSQVEIADDADERALGLGGRSEIPDDYGMLFVFEVADIYGFWMKDMQAPIDIVWLSDNGTIVGINANVSPDSFPETFQPEVPVRYVLETRAGFANERGWTPGYRVSLPL